MKTLMIAPHMDDEAISCGGLLGQLSTLHVPAHVLAIHGQYYRESPRSQAEDDQVESSDFYAALRVLNVSGQANCLTEGEPGHVGFYPLLKLIEGVLAQFQPVQVIIPSADDLNQDHRHLNHVCKIALRPINLGKVKRVLEFAALDGKVRAVNFFVPLRRSDLDRKLSAVNCYRREVRVLPSPRAPENVEAQARVWGAMCGHEFAEAYNLHLER